MIIVGAGMAGLLAARMLAHRQPVVVDVQPTLPNNHSAVLRFASPLIGELLGIEFKKVNLIKSVLPWKNPVADTLAYAMKNTGIYASDRSISLRERSATSERWIAPADLIKRMSTNVDIRFNTPHDFTSGEKVLSTIPMPSLMRALDYPRKIEFRYRHGLNVVVELKNCDAYASLLIPDPSTPISRISITGSEMVIELPGTSRSDYSDEALLCHALWSADLMGIRSGSVTGFQVKEQRYAKIVAIDEDERRAFIHWASTVKGKAWQLGRFATWRPGLLLDSLPHDIRLIDKWMRSRTPAADIEMYEARQ
jgi:hypothetical protein